MMGQRAKSRYAATTTPYPADWRRQDYSGVRRDWRGLSLIQGEGPKQLILNIVKASEPLPIDQATFQRLAKTWRRETAVQSSLIKKVIHPAYQRIIGMGPAVLPLILREMARKPDHWFWALDAITQGESPAQGVGDLDQATQAWIRWGEEKGYL